MVCDLVLKLLLKRVQLCHQILIWTLDIETTAFLFEIVYSLHDAEVDQCGKTTKKKIVIGDFQKRSSHIAGLTLARSLNKTLNVKLTSEIWNLKNKEIVV